MAYQQIELDTNSGKYSTTSTSKMLFQYTRLIYGLVSASVFLDDILISAANRKAHVERLKKVLQLLSDVGFKLSSERCEFFAKRIKYLSHIIDKDGLHVDPGKLQEIQRIPY